MTNEQIDNLLIALHSEGFALPYAAQSDDYKTREELRAADDEAWQRNREALRTALASGWENPK